MTQHVLIENIDRPDQLKVTLYDLMYFQCRLLQDPYYQEKYFLLHQVLYSFIFNPIACVLMREIFP